jgi:hypothetical protein
MALSIRDSTGRTTVAPSLLREPCGESFQPAIDRLPGAPLGVVCHPSS